MTQFIADIATTMLARLLAMMGPFAVSVITARILGPEERGRYFLILAIAQIGSQIANLGLQSSNTYLVANRHELAGRLMMNSFLVSFIVAPIVTLPIALAFGWPDLAGLSSLVGPALGPISLVAVLLSPIFLFAVLVNNLALGLGRVRLFNGLTIAYSLVALVTTLSFAPFGTLTIFLLSAAISVALPMIYGAYCILGGQPPYPRFDFQLFESGIFFASRVYLATMFGFIMARVGAFALHHQGSIEEVGQFSVASQLTDGLTMLPSTIGLLLFPEFLRAESDQRWSTLWRTFWGVAVIMTIVLGSVAALAPWIIQVLFGDSFARAAVLTQALLPSVLIVSLVTVVSQYLSAEGFPRIQVFAWLIGLIVQTGLSYWLAPKWAGVGVSLSIALSYALVLALLLYEVLSRKRVGAC
ncbi:polysaccharide biosynthesis C-terminal domain-containing protein [Bradyrhizobium sp.]|uniref:oligosaccharide flippase family protein n=1 Tax=Bradyrhizobium sp. TaxID=376 RepID=UPI001D4DBB58|nr:polysaccharide biosynthesis C-terminal domain-containing protein [Bradyrhizobium sp.]MBI5321090.1 polysaccharide biosynthesis C-terminal domain-containing protein [Bradyrhizobium sp.]